ncbi:hypothetical protein [Nesterenkonia sp. CF4.4]|uniref:hypothetical protein n=1 Tax=Nesterenkonia sp. CF4.4 TaxID=3373079 RepID=UPI003EE6324A
MEGIPSQRESLIAGALTGSLHEDEWQDLDRARAADPAIDAELEELREVIARLDAADMTWREESLPAGLEERILAETIEAGHTGHPGRDSGSPSSSS